MKLIRYTPFNDIDFWGDSLNRFFNDSGFTSKRGSTWMPAVDIIGREDTVTLNMELPGLDKEAISVNIEEKVLTVKGERKFEKEEQKTTCHRREIRYGSFERSFSLSDDVLTDAVTADYKDGILKITLKKDKSKETVKQISVH